jgi:hypothetical protein
MRNSIIVKCFIFFIFMSCNTVGSKPDNFVDSPNNLKKSDTIIRSGFEKDSSVKAPVENILNKQILGIWAFVGDVNATFIIAKDTISYPDQNKSFKYLLTHDSLYIKFDGYDGSYLIKMKNIDTMILTGDEVQIYYRYKRK